MLVGNDASRKQDEMVLVRAGVVAPDHDVALTDGVPELLIPDLGHMEGDVDVLAHDPRIGVSARSGAGTNQLRRRQPDSLPTPRGSTLFFGIHPEVQPRDLSSRPTRIIDSRLFQTMRAAERKSATGEVRLSIVL